MRLWSELNGGWLGPEPSELHFRFLQEQFEYLNCKSPCCKCSTGWSWEMSILTGKENNFQCNSRRLDLDLILSLLIRRDTSFVKRGFSVELDYCNHAEVASTNSWKSSEVFERPVLSITCLHQRMSRSWLVVYNNPLHLLHTYCNHSHYRTHSYNKLL